jgi:Secretion system C-terminal sorting domain
MWTIYKSFGTIICLFAVLTLHAASLTTIRSGSWYDPTIWDKGVMPTKWDKATIAYGTTVTVFGPYTDCDSLTINGFLDVGGSNLTIGGRDLQIDVRAIRNTECLVNGRLRINGDWTHQFKVYGNVKFTKGSIFEMSAGAVMIDGCAFTAALSVPAYKPLLDVTDAAVFSVTGGIITMFNPHYYPNGITIKGARNFYNVSFGNNLTLSNFACRSTSDFILSETDKPKFNGVRLAYLPHPNRQNKVVLNDVTVATHLDVTCGLLTGAGRLKVGGNVLIGTRGKLELDIELNNREQQGITSYMSNKSAVITGNIYINNPNRVLLGIDLELQNGTLHLIQGQVNLNDKTLTLPRAPEGGSTTSYLFSNHASAGGLLVKNLAGRVIFPVGTENSYVPVILTGIGDYKVIAKPLYNHNPLGINVQWQINRSAGGSIADVQVLWNAQNEGHLFKNTRNNAQLHQLENNIWIPKSEPALRWPIQEQVFTLKLYKTFLPAFSTLTVQAKGASAQKVQGSNIANELQENISIYPNPISSESFLNLRLNMDNPLDTKIMIFNVNQQLVYQNTFPSGDEFKIPVDHLGNGLYSVQIWNGTQQFYQKFVKN